MVHTAVVHITIIDFFVVSSNGSISETTVPIMKSLNSPPFTVPNVNSTPTKPSVDIAAIADILLP